MKASVLDLRYRMKDILHALDKNELVTIFYRGKKKGVLYPAKGQGVSGASATEHPVFGIWKDRDDMQDVGKVLRNIRKGRSHAV